MTPTERILTALSDRNCDPRQNGKGWSARCPAHEDRRPSLSISEGDDGRVLVRCHAGCTAEAVCGALGLRARDLMPDDPSTLSTSTQLRSSRAIQQKRRQQGGKAAKTYPTAKDAIAALESQHGKRSALWTYHDAGGDPAGVVVRWDLRGGKKDIRPAARHNDGWRVGGMPEPRPLYRLPKLTDATRVFITEGEKAADAARAIGLVATTSAHGSQSPDKTDWTPLAGKECIILPDHDQPGEKYASAVAAILTKLAPVAVVKVVRVPHLPPGGDIADWVAIQGESDAASLRREVEALVDEAEVIESQRPKYRIERFRPFPTDALPEPVRGFVVAGAKAIGCDASYLALPLLTVLAAAIGNARRIQLKRGWTAPAILWTTIVGESGTAKSPAFKLVMQPLRDLQRKALETHAEAQQQYEAELAQHDNALSAWKRDKNADGLPPAKP